MLRGKLPTRLMNRQFSVELARAVRRFDPPAMFRTINI